MLSEMQRRERQKQTDKKTMRRERESRKISGATKNNQRSVTSPGQGDGKEESRNYSDIGGRFTGRIEGQGLHGEEKRLLGGPMSPVNHHR